MNVIGRTPGEFLLDCGWFWLVNLVLAQWWLNLSLVGGKMWNICVESENLGLEDIHECFHIITTKERVHQNMNTSCQESSLHISVA